MKKLATISSTLLAIILLAGCGSKTAKKAHPTHAASTILATSSSSASKTAAKQVTGAPLTKPGQWTNSPQFGKVQLIRNGKINKKLTSGSYVVTLGAVRFMRVTVNKASQLDYAKTHFGTKTIAKSYYLVDVEYSVQSTVATSATGSGLSTLTTATQLKPGAGLAKDDNNFAIPAKTTVAQTAEAAIPTKDAENLAAITIAFGSITTKSKQVLKLPSMKIALK